MEPDNYRKTQGGKKEKEPKRKIILAGRPSEKRKGR